MILLAVFVWAVGGCVGGYFGQWAGETYAGQVVFFRWYHDRSPIYNLSAPAAQVSLKTRNQEERATPRYAPLQEFDACLDRIGLLTGSGAGALAGILWSTLVLKPACLRKRSKPVDRSGRIGVLAGCLATVALHATLWTAGQLVDTMLLAIGLFIAVFVGAIAGVLCGTLCSVMLKWEQTNP